VGIRNAKQKQAGEQLKTRASKNKKCLYCGLDRKTLKESDAKNELGKWLRPAEISAILIRRDKIAAYFEGPGATQTYEHVPSP
jgi:hypothetical protein